MRQVQLLGALLALLLSSLFGQVATAGNAVVPPLVKFGGVLSDVNGKPVTGVVGVTFSLYKDQQGGVPLWMETQNVHPDSRGHYTVELGSTSSEGLPTNLFASGEAHWLGVQAQGQEEQPRVLLLSVPYALKAGDAETVGGLPPSAFVLAAPPSSTAPGTAAGASSTSTGGSVAPPAGAVTGVGTPNFVTLWDSPSDIISSVIFQSGSGSAAKVGINTITPSTTLDVKGAATIRGTFGLPATGAATAAKGMNSQPLVQAASSFNSSTSAAVNQAFQWQAEPAGNNTSAPSGTLNLLFGSGVSATETGLNISGTGLITFAPGQTFPGTGNGTITGVTAGTDLTGGGSSGSVTLSLDTTKVAQLGSANTFTANQTVNGTVTATAFSGSGASVTNVNASRLGGLSSSGFAQLAINNTFTGKQTINNTTTMTGSDTAGVLQATNTALSGKGPAIVGTTNSSAAAGIKGVVAATTGTEAGVFGTTSSPDGDGVSGTGGTGVKGTSTSGPVVGVYGIANAGSARLNPFGAGVWGDTNGVGGGLGSVGVAGTANASYAGFFWNKSNDNFAPTVAIQNDSTFSTDLVFTAVGAGFGDAGSCSIDTSGNLTCTGSKSALVPVDGGARRVALYAVEAPENWFEDVGSGQLSHGSARVTLDSVFAQTVTTGIEYHVFLTPKGDCKGLYVSHESATSFEVHELGGGTSSVGFDYRIMARRSGYENIRMADLTERWKSLELQRERVRQQRGGQHTASASEHPPATKLTSPGGPKATAR